jgi:hypothetical protein
VRRVDQPREPLGAAVGGVRGIGVEAVVTPAAVPWEGRHRHQLDRGHAEVAQLAEVRDHAVERSFFTEGADVELVAHELLQRHAAPRLVAPAEGGRVDDPGGPADPFRLEARARVGPGLRLVEHVEVVRAGGDVELRLPEALLLALERLVAAVVANRDCTRVRRPDAEGHGTVTRRRGAEPRMKRALAGRHGGERTRRRS